MSTARLQLLLVVSSLTLASGARRMHKASQSTRPDDDLDAFLNSLDPPRNDPVTVVQRTDLDHSPHTGPPQRVGDITQLPPAQQMRLEQDAILTEETVRDHEDQLHHDERHRMQCNKVMEGQGIGEQRASTFEGSSLYVAEDRDLYADPNDERTVYGANGRMPNDPHNSHPLHYHECLRTKVHTVRKIAMLDELDMAPFLQKVGELDIEGVAHAALGDDKHFVEVQLMDPKSTRITLGVGRTTSSRKNGWGLDTIKPDGVPNMDSPHPLQKWIITSKTWDKEVRPRLDALAKEFTMKNLGMATEDKGVSPAPNVSCDDFATLTDPKHINFKAEMTCLLKAIEMQEKYVPFNHKLEMMQLVFQRCEFKEGGMFNSKGTLNCNSAGTLYVHDDKLIQDSADGMMLDWIVPSTSSRPTDLRSYLPPGLKIEPDQMHLEGSINWAVTVSKKGYCTEASAPLLYIGTGADEDPDDPDDDVDLDLGAMFFRWKTSSGSARTQMEEVGSLFFGSNGQKPAQLYEASPGKFATRACPINGAKGSTHTPSSTRQRDCGSSNKATPALAEYSGDNLSGEGEGDDEWLILDLEKLRKAGITHVAIMVNIYNQRDVKTFEKVDGAFLRAVMSGRSEKEWSTATTAQYVDLDTMPSAKGKTAALVAVLYVDEISHILAPKVSMEESYEKPINKLNEDMTKLMHLWKNAGAIDADKRKKVEDKLREMRDDRDHVAKTRFEVAVAKEGIPCASQGCSLPKSRDGVKQFFLNQLSPTPAADHDSKIADVHDKAASANAIVNNDVEAQTVPGSGVEELDEFLASLDADIQPSPILDSTGSGRVSDAERYASQQAMGMSEQDLLQQLLIDFPGGPPGADTLCLKDTAKRA